VTVAAEVARNYFELRGAEKRLSVARENLSTEHQTLELTQLLDDTGRGSELDVQRSRARLKATEATIPPLEAAEKQRAIDWQFSWASDRARWIRASTGSRCDLRQGSADRRPGRASSPAADVRAAERQLAAATARVGVATADLFPRACSRLVVSRKVGRRSETNRRTMLGGTGRRWPLPRVPSRRRAGVRPHVHRAAGEEARPGRRSAEPCVGRTAAG